jgi:hypothetical protein
MPLVNPPVIIKDEGTTQGAVNTINFTGTAVTATVVGNVATVSITSGSGSFTVTEIEVDFGSSPTRTKTFTVVDAGITASSKLIITQSGHAATGRQADENEMDPILFSGTPGSGQFILIANALTGPVAGKYRVNYTAS